jgi:hypothetical protein
VCYIITDSNKDNVGCDICTHPIWLKMAAEMAGSNYASCTILV